MVVYGTRVTLQDNSAPTASLAGPLLDARLAQADRAGDYYSASDNSGIRSATLTAGPLTATDTALVRLHLQGAVLERVAAAPWRSRGTLPDGQYPVTAAR